MISSSLMDIHGQLGDDLLGISTGQKDRRSVYLGGVENGFPEKHRSTIPSQFHTRQLEQILTAPHNIYKRFLFLVM